MSGAVRVRVRVPCKFCNLEFDSRNALFRHLRSSKQCFEKVTQQQSQAPTDNKNARGFVEKLEKRKLAIQFGYAVSPEWDDGEPIFTLASAATLRHPSLSQENSCSALADVAGINYRGGLSNGIHDTGTGTERLVEEMQILADEMVVAEAVIHSNSNSKSKSSESSLSCVQILGVEYLSASTNFHAEKSCTQRAYQYLVPIHWIDTSTETREWIRSKLQTRLDSDGGHEHQVQANTRDSTTTTTTTIPTPTPTPTSLVRFKKILKLVESRDVTQIPSSSLPSDPTDTVVSSAGRYGLLWKKERRPYHNFCDPSLGSGSMASPSNEHVWRSVDRCRLHGFVVENDDEPFVVVEIRGDGFVAQQVRRIVASVVAVSNGWLPEEFFESATRTDIAIETPIAPAELLYLSAARFHFVDLILPAPLFGTTLAMDRGSRWRSSLQSKLLLQQQRRPANNPEKDSTSSCWLTELRIGIGPRIRSTLSLRSQQARAAAASAAHPFTTTTSTTTEPTNPNATASNDAHHEESIGDESLRTTVTAPYPDPDPYEYRKVLSLLREVCDRKQWPRTLDGRSRFLRSPRRLSNGPEVSNGGFHPKRTSRPVSSEFQGQLFQCGSFTIVNPELFRGKVPGMNEQWPELVEAVFELEAHCLSTCSQNACGRNMNTNTNTNTKGSTHCIVNRNTEFTPHFLNGKGKEGTHATVVVGLGDYAGGTIRVDEKSFDIRYEPLRFDGWTQIHSTECFQGERFSLLWFTPERREEVQLPTVENNTSFEDSHAKSLVAKHDLTLPDYPPLNFRSRSTDALVINEILDPATGCAYELSQKAWSSMIQSRHRTNEAQQTNGFSLRGHEVVLDIGAHIGVFSRYALGAGCKKVIAYEPEFENAKLLEYNLTPVGRHERKHEHEHEHEATKAVHVVRKCAVAHGEPGQCNFVNARNRTDGTLNSWRHSLEKYSNYVDRKGGKLVSTEQDAVLARSRVQTIPFFGNCGALHPGITFVKMDCEGAEIDVLLSTEASQTSNWLDVTHLVFEWSFTKERRITEFHKAVNNLVSAGFDVVYEGQGSWWDTEPNCMWPYHNDLVVFARKQNKNCICNL
eukprot:jgi/Psemu1/284102/fgenesh1_pg.42_\